MYSISYIVVCVAFLTLPVPIPSSTPEVKCDFTALVCVAFLTLPVPVLCFVHDESATQ
ncbi:MULTISPECIES: hypothetical protein [unclassified Hydrogenobaculum]|uniref:hypothetical protein n=1 Tax=Hydrogenobaculum sp. (strain Y04AAS1) TaxID=380749 RepID=UPI0012EAB861